jgi:hypothetical protein
VRRFHQLLRRRDVVTLKISVHVTDAAGHDAIAQQTVRLVA